LKESRREFIKQAAAVATVLLIPGIPEAKNKPLFNTGYGTIHITNDNKGMNVYVDGVQLDKRHHLILHQKPFSSIRIFRDTKHTNAVDIPITSHSLQKTFTTKIPYFFGDK